MAVNESGNYTNPSLRASIVAQVKAGSVGGKPGEWTLRKSQIVAKKYKEAGGGYKGTKKPPQEKLISSSTSDRGKVESPFKKSAVNMAEKVKPISKKVEFSKSVAGKKPVEAKDEKSTMYKV